MKESLTDVSQICTSTVETCETLILDHGLEKWIKYQRDSLARIFLVREKVLELMANARVSGVRSSAQLGLFDQNSYFSKTRLKSEHGDGMSSSVNSWRSDIPGETDSCQRLMSERFIKGIDGGVLLPTLLSSNGGRTLPPGTTMTGMTPDGKKRTAGLDQALKMILTKNQDAETLPTLTARDHRPRGKTTSFQNLQHAIQRLPTLCASDYKTAYSEAGYQKQIQKRSKPLRDTLVIITGHRLTPGFCEWYMGWPIGATALNHSVTGKFRSKQQPHGGF